MVFGLVRVRRYSLRRRNNLVLGVLGEVEMFFEGRSFVLNLVLKDE